MTMFEGKWIAINRTGGMYRWLPRKRCWALMVVHEPLKRRERPRMVRYAGHPDSARSAIVA